VVAGLYTMARPWNDVAAAKRAKRDALMKPHRIISEDASGPDASITDIDDVSVLMTSLESGEFSAETLTRTYIEK
jgi:hypothetical protein